MRTVHSINLAISLAFASQTSAQLVGYDFDAVTLLARGALVGQAVGEPVLGFDLRLQVDGRPAYHQAFGQWTVNQLSNIDSTTKTLSGALIMSLVDSSPSSIPFSLDSRISQFIPEYDTPEKRAITIRQAFSHTSGFGQSGIESNTTRSLYENAVVAASIPLVHSPGDDFAYGGTSMHIAGAVAELAGQADWNTLIRQRILDPLGMDQTSYVLTTPTNPRIAGGAESNASEFGRFMQMLADDGTIQTQSGQTPSGAQTILSAQSIDAMFTRQTATDVNVVNSPYLDEADYGVGVWLSERDASNQVTSALAAGARGFHSWIDFDDDLVGVFSTQTTTFGNVEALHRLIRQAAAESVRNPALAGDADRDGVVGFTDLLRLAQNYRPGIPGRLWSQGDFTGDGFANFLDLLVLSQNYGNSGFSESFIADWTLARSLVPEPTLVGTVGSLQWMLLTRRRAGARRASGTSCTR
jgi:CubicO group peptidase (beta-lactamase class C family)